MPLNFNSQDRHAVPVRRTVSRIASFAKILGAILLLARFVDSVHASAVNDSGQSITLAWNANLDTNVVGYNIYYGVASRTYTNEVNVGNVTNATISGLVAGVTYYFAVTAYDNLGQESGYSSEIVYTVPATPVMVQIRSAPAGQLILTVSGSPGQNYNVMATSDLVVWTVISTVTLGAGGTVDFTDTNAASFPQRFYRTQTSP